MKVVPLFLVHIKKTISKKYSFCSVAWNFPKKMPLLLLLALIALNVFSSFCWKLYEPQFLKTLLLTLVLKHPFQLSISLHRCVRLVVFTYNKYFDILDACSQFNAKPKQKSVNKPLNYNIHTKKTTSNNCLQSWNLTRIVIKK